MENDMFTLYLFIFAIIVLIYCLCEYLGEDVNTELYRIDRGYYMLPINDSDFAEIAFTFDATMLTNKFNFLTTHDR